LETKKTPMKYYLSLELLSDASFASGDSLPGEVDLEIEYDQAGCPQLGARALKGLLREEYEHIRRSLGSIWNDEWQAAATFLFGEGGASGDREAQMHVAVARLPVPLLEALHAQVAAGMLRPADVLASLTTIRRQTAIDVTKGAPEHGSLRSSRVLIAGTTLFAELFFESDPPPKALMLLTACALGLRRAGSDRNRGRGRIKTLLHCGAIGQSTTDTDFSHKQFQAFQQLLLATQAA
jgi:hypothetical protein